MMQPFDAYFIAFVILMFLWHWKDEIKNRLFEIRRDLWSIRDAIIRETPHPLIVQAMQWCDGSLDCEPNHFRLMYSRFDGVPTGLSYYSDSEFCADFFIDPGVEITILKGIYDKEIKSIVTTDKVTELLGICEAEFRAADPSISLVTSSAVTSSVTESTE